MVRNKEADCDMIVRKAIVSWGDILYITVVADNALILYTRGEEEGEPRS